MVSCRGPPQNTGPQAIACFACPIATPLHGTVKCPLDAYFRISTVGHPGTFHILFYKYCEISDSLLCTVNLEIQLISNTGYHQYYIVGKYKANDFI